MRPCLNRPVKLSVCLCVSGEVSLPAWRPIFDIMLSLSLHSPKKGLSCFSRPDNYFSLIPACQGQSQPSIEARERDHFPSPLFSGSFLFHLSSSISLTLSHSPTSRPRFLFFSFLLSPPSSPPPPPQPLSACRRVTLTSFLPSWILSEYICPVMMAASRWVSRSPPPPSGVNTSREMRVVAFHTHDAEQTKLRQSFHPALLVTPPALIVAAFTSTAVPRHSQPSLKGSVVSVFLFLR